MTSVKDRTTASRSPGDGSQDLKSRNSLSWDNTTLTLQTSKQRPRAKPPHALVSSLLPGAAPDDGTGAHLAQGAEEVVLISLGLCLHHQQPKCNLRWSLCWGLCLRIRWVHHLHMLCFWDSERNTRPVDLHGFRLVFDPSEHSHTLGQEVAPNEGELGHFLPLASCQPCGIEWVPGRHSSPSWFWSQFNLNYPLSISSSCLVSGFPNNYPWWVFLASGEFCFSMSITALGREADQRGLPPFSRWENWGLEGITAVSWCHRWVHWPAGPGPFPLCHTLPSTTKCPVPGLQEAHLQGNPKEIPPCQLPGFVGADFPLRDTQSRVLHMYGPGIMCMDTSLKPKALNPLSV